jgi:ferredoxin-NADP reductase
MVAFARAGAQNDLLLHGVRSTAELYYRDLLTVSSKHYLPCITGGEDNPGAEHKIFCGRVTDYLALQLATGEYDFYLCGRGEMLRDATRIIDRRFSESRVFSELFF